MRSTYSQITPFKFWIVDSSGGVFWDLSGTTKPRMDTDLVPLSLLGGTVLSDMGSTFFIMDMSGNKSVLRKVQIYQNAEFTNLPLSGPEMLSMDTSIGYGVGFLYLANPNPAIMIQQNITGMN